MEKLLLLFHILAWNICMTTCDQNCDCSEVTLLKEMFQKVMFEQQLETSRLQARIRRLEFTKKTSPVPSEGGSVDSAETDRLEQTEKKVADIDSKLNDLLTENSKRNKNNIDIMWKGLKSEKRERKAFISAVQNKVANINESFATKLQEIQMDTDSNLKEVSKEMTETKERVSTLNEKAITMKIDGGWSLWGDWSTCSVSCGGGVRERSRTCTSPKPSELGKQCEGNNVMAESCGDSHCSKAKVAFTAYGTNNENRYGTIKFPKTHLSIGGGYSTNTGRFTCHIPGIYNFAVTLTKNHDVRQETIVAYLRLNSSLKFQLYSRPLNSGDTKGSDSLSVTGNFHLSKNDYVSVFGNPSDFYGGYTSFFTGVLVIPDN